MGQWVGAQDRPKFPRHALIVTSPQNPHRKQKTFFFDVN